MIALLAVLSLAAGLGADARTLSLRNAHSGEALRLQPFALFGIPERVAWARLNHFFRSWRTQRARPIHPRLLRVLAQIQQHCGGRPIELVSGFRVPDHRDRLNSYHNVGRAADIRIAGVPNRTLFDYCLTLTNLGCGLYPYGSHVHVDVRSRPGVWVDFSGHGESAEYVRNVWAWLRNHPQLDRSRLRSPR